MNADAFGICKSFRRKDSDPSISLLGQQISQKIETSSATFARFGVKRQKRQSRARLSSLACGLDFSRFGSFGQNHDSRQAQYWG